MSAASEQGVDLWGRAEGTILLVEDDARVRAVCRSVLRREGYEVIDASDPEEAIEMFRRHRDEIDLVISDIVMPHMTGTQLAEVLRRDRPDLPLLFVSGYAPDDVLGPGVDARSLLRKPFGPAELLRRVSRRLHGLDSQAPPPISMDQTTIGLESGLREIQSSKSPATIASAQRRKAAQEGFSGAGAPRPRLDSEDL